jgi:hypothetical protein
MGVPQAIGYPDFGSSGVSKYTPQIFAMKLIENFYNATFFRDITNSDYEG